MIHTFDVLGFSYHLVENPWHTAPAWALELAIRLGALQKELRKIMDQNDDLKNAVAFLANGMIALDVAILAEIQAIANANAGANEPNPVIAQAIANIQAVTTKMAQDAAALTASIPSATTISPPATSTPVVDVAPTVAPPALAPVAAAPAENPAPSSDAAVVGNPPGEAPPSPAFT